MRVFLSHASEQKTTAEQVALSLRSRGYTVFLDRDDLPAAQSFDERIEAGVAASDFMVFLISPESVTQGRYTLTELFYARRKWGTPHGRVLPVMIAPTPMSAVPEFLKAVTIMEPMGNAAAEISSAVHANRITEGNRILMVTAAAGVVSGMASSLTKWIPFGTQGFDLGAVQIVTFWPSIFFGAALSFAFWRFARSSVPSLILLFAAIQLSWQTAVNIAVRIHSKFFIGAEGGATSEGQAIGDLLPSGGVIEFNGRFILPGLAAGAAGALGTWLGACLAGREVRSASVASLCMFTGLLAGLLLTLNNGPILYCTWQAAIAAVLGNALMRGRS